MILYHGSNLAIPKPDILHSRPYVDFGRGFYATPLKEQAEQWCKRYKRQGKEAVLSIYSMDERKMAERKLLSFDTYSLDWLDFVVKCRSGQDKSDYDIVIGGIANDKVFNTVELFGLIHNDILLLKKIQLCQERFCGSLNSINGCSTFA